jgi:nucleoside-diphosphate-sugar epimerase
MEIKLPKQRSILVIGGAGYIGSVLTRELLALGHRVSVLDSLLYGNGGSLAAVAEHRSFSFVRGDVRSPEDIRSALGDMTDVILLAALVGDPVCKRNPKLATETNLGGARNVLEACDESVVERLVFASTCSNYGLREDDEPAEEADELNPLSLYASTKVEMEREILERAETSSFAPTVLRISTAYGVSPRMRFDLTVSEFTRELALGRELEVYDADTWRPYCHVADISRAIIAVLGAPTQAVAGEVFNVGGDDGNHTKRSIVKETQAALGGEGRVIWSKGGADPRNYHVSFAKIRERLGFVPEHSVAASIERLIEMVRAGIFADVESRPLYYGNLEFSAPAPAAVGEGRGGGDSG